MEETIAPNKSGFKREILPPLSPIARYHLFHTVTLSLAPILCFCVLLMLLAIFSQLNLFFLEANGLILESQVRDAYYRQVEAQVLDVIGFFLLLTGVTAVTSFLVMRWASAPFVRARQTLLTAMREPDRLRPSSPLLSESPTFDRLVWNFALRVKSGGAAVKGGKAPRFGMNFPFLGKFIFVFATLSVVTGYVMSIMLDSIYTRIISLALQFVPAAKMHAHFFLAQQEMLRDVTTILTVISVVYYVGVGVIINRYMSTMLWLFSRTIVEDRFPLTVRQSDIYPALADTLNQARGRLQG